MGLAFHYYHETYGSLPPALLNDQDSDPVHSWRILILPYWDRKDLYSNYDFSVSWNHPANSRVAAYRDDNSFFYGCLSGQSQQSGTTNYVAVIGDGTAWPGRTASKFVDFTDDLATTILVLEVPDNDILWLEPKDITLEQLLAQGLEGNHAYHVNVLFADGRVDKIRKDIDSTTLRALLTISGGETINAEDWQVAEIR